METGNSNFEKKGGEVLSPSDGVNPRPQAGTMTLEASPRGDRAVGRHSRGNAATGDRQARAGRCALSLSPFLCRQRPLHGLTGAGAGLPADCCGHDLEEGGGGVSIAQENSVSVSA